MRSPGGDHLSTHRGDGEPVRGEGGRPAPESPPQRDGGSGGRGQEAEAEAAAQGQGPGSRATGGRRWGQSRRGCSADVSRAGSQKKKTWTTKVDEGPERPGGGWKLE